MYEIRDTETDTWMFINPRHVEKAIQKGNEVYKEGKLWKKPNEALTENEKKALSMEIDRQRR